MRPIRDLWDQIKEAFKGYPDWVSEAVVGAFLGLVVGFLCRTVGRYVLVTTVVLGVTGFVFHYTGLATFHSEPLVKIFGVDSFPAIGDLFASAFAWMKDHLAACVTTILGFILGWRLGG